MGPLVTTDAGKDKTCFVAYSLGNFYLMDSSVATNCCGIVLNLSFTKQRDRRSGPLRRQLYPDLHFA